ncbi:SDR family mycofactocin-dependent oxidoreductase [Streptomyces sp. SAI-144]|jgi:SDR family mycofactocin-dependent oxidoreductase|uniref:mycofactocin-coupled SDR family oxidoreductase n=1 Tax=unclassified Streptomyces TaxID=2593676 RepID=UPI0024755698|nr:MULTISPECIES: mycofactocin-coupled SDR family oxidoreductase [unclassified Streptomyces]MDH6436730.1 SDR family mycofactocin-dependent oxidoreductase [Streptomyces sp. SAI-144]MDH6484130.1 SDR family mycofactocin-dependent oxidoreductase [Streptomyces sp. SAI-127]
MGRVEGKVAFITGAARGQGRSHAVRLAEEGADIIAVDLCRDYETVGYKMATPDDLKETVRLVEAQGRRVVALQSDVRSMADMREAVRRGVAELGGLDIVVAQAGIAPLRGEPKLQAWCDAVDVDLIGTINAIQAALPQLREGASVIATGSTAALMDHGIVAEPGSNPGGAGYAFAKRALSEYIHELARNLAPLKQRANVVHPTNCDTPMLQSEPMYRSFRPDLDNPTRADAEPSFAVQQAMPVPYVEPLDISNAVLFLASDEARYITGTQLRVDAGGYLKWHDWRR